MYKTPSVIPKIFDLDITPAADDKYLINGEQGTLRDLYWRIREAAHSPKPVNTILYHHNGQGTSMQYICYLMLVYKEQVASFYENDGKITAAKMTSDNEESFNLFYQQCLDSVISQ